MSNLIDWKSLRKFNLFTRLDDSRLQEIAGFVTVGQFREGEIICNENANSRSMFFLEEGRVLVSKKDVPLAYLEEGEYFGEMSLLEGKQRTATVKTVRDSIIYEISSETFDKFLRASPEAMHDIVITFDKRLRKHNLLVIDQYLKLKEQYHQLQETHNQLLQTEKLASIGMITSGIAHEINNPLTIISGYIEILQDKMADDTNANPFYPKTFEKIGNAAEAIRKIVINLKSYVSSNSDNIVIDLNKTIQASIDLVSYLYRKEQIELETNLCSENPMIIANIGKLQQVIMNLLSNSKDAMDESEIKKITISTSTENSNAIIKVTDSGTGIDSDKIDKIFDKFYSTKPVGKGTGLGLDIIKSIIEEIKGRINVESKPGNGATFIISIPLKN